MQVLPEGEPSLRSVYEDLVVPDRLALIPGPPAELPPSWLPQHLRMLQAPRYVTALAPPCHPLTASSPRWGRKSRRSHRVPSLQRDTDTQRTERASPSATSPHLTTSGTRAPRTTPQRRTPSLPIPTTGRGQRRAGPSALTAARRCAACGAPPRTALDSRERHCAQLEGAGREGLPRERTDGHPDLQGHSPQGSEQVRLGHRPHRDDAGGRWRRCDSRRQAVERLPVHHQALVSARPVRQTVIPLTPRRPRRREGAPVSGAAGEVQGRGGAEGEAGGGAGPRAPGERAAGAERRPHTPPPARSLSLVANNTDVLDTDVSVRPSLHPWNACVRLEDPRYS